MKSPRERSFSLIPMTGSEKAASVFSLFFGEFDLAEIEIRGILLG
jgi:hypothetical protein